LGVTVPTASPLSSPQLAVIQKPADATAPQPPAPARKETRAADPQAPPLGSARGRLLDIVI
jgi:hypothetical protein